MLKMIFSKIFFFSLLTILPWSAVYGMEDIQEGSSKHTSWVISAEALKTNFGDINVEEFISSLKSAGITAEVKPYKEYLDPYKVLEGKLFTIYLAPTFHHENHVWILANSHSLPSFEKLGIKELQELENFRYLMGEVYKQYFTYPGYVAFMDLKKNYGSGNLSVCLEMIPTSLKGLQHDEIDASEKLKRYYYFLFKAHSGKQDLLEEVERKKEKLSTFLKELQKREHTLEAQKRIEKNTLPWKQKAIPSATQIQEHCIQKLIEDLMQCNGVRPGTSSSFIQAKKEISNFTQKDGEFIDAREDVIEIKNCAFCNPTVIRNQLVYDFGHFVCLYNFRPLSLGNHFLITPRVHVEDWQNFSLTDVLQIDQIAQAIVTAIKEESLQDDIILFFQNSLAAGMSVPHNHLHVLLRPAKIQVGAQVLLEMATGESKKGLTNEEMAPTIQKFKTRIRQLWIPKEN